MAATERVSCPRSSTAFPFTDTITSPAFTPAFAAGAPATTSCTTAPLAFSGSPKPWARSAFRSLMVTPRYPRAILLPFSSCGRSCFTRLTGTAKPIPCPICGETMAVLIPTTSPFMLKSGPPEFPGLMAASVWMKSSKGPFCSERSFAETIPKLADSRRPKGLPMASTKSPCSSASESPSATVGRSAGAFSSRISATSVGGSLPTTLALNSRPSGSFTLISVASPTTWLLVRTYPSRLMMNPEPRLLERNSGISRGWPK
jgi:hypothetical protein